MESIELMGKEVLPEFIERDAEGGGREGQAAGAGHREDRVAPARVDRAEVRRAATRSVACPPVAAESSPRVRFPRRWPRSTRAASRRRSGSKTSNEVSQSLGQIDELWRYDGRRAVVTGCASGIGAHVVRQLTELGAHVVGLDKQPPSVDITEFHAVDLTDPASIDQRRERRSADRSMRCSTSPGSPPGSAIRCWSLTINFLGLRHVTEALFGEDAGRIVHRERVIACG